MIRCACEREGAAVLGKVLSEGSWKVRGASRGRRRTCGVPSGEAGAQPASGVHSQFKIRSSPLQGLNEGTRA